MVQINIQEPQTVDIDIISAETVDVKVESELVRVGDYEEYKGPYSVKPEKFEQKLPTADKHISKDILVKQVPFAAVSNNAGGTTVIIG